MLIREQPKSGVGGLAFYFDDGAEKHYNNWFVFLSSAGAIFINAQDISNVLGIGESWLLSSSTSSVTPIPLTTLSGILIGKITSQLQSISLGLGSDSAMLVFSYPAVQQTMFNSSPRGTTTSVLCAALTNASDWRLEQASSVVVDANGYDMTFQRFVTPARLAEAGLKYCKRIIFNTVAQGYCLYESNLPSRGDGVISWGVNTRNILGRFGFSISGGGDLQGLTYNKVSSPRIAYASNAPGRGFAFAKDFKVCNNNRACFTFFNDSNALAFNGTLLGVTSDASSPSSVVTSGRVSYAAGNNLIVYSDSTGAVFKVGASVTNLLGTATAPIAFAFNLGSYVSDVLKVKMFANYETIYFYERGGDTIFAFGAGTAQRMPGYASGSGVPVPIFSGHGEIYNLYVSAIAATGVNDNLQAVSTSEGIWLWGYPYFAKNTTYKTPLRVDI